MRYNKNMDIEREIQELKKRIEVLESLLSPNGAVVAPSPSKEKMERDKTRYMFASKVLPKNRLVLAVVSAYIKDNNPDFETLQNAFDKSLQGSLSVVETIENAQKIKDAAKRYFMDSSFTLRDGSEVVVCTQWGIFNIAKFIKQASMLGYHIEEIKMQKFI